MRSRSIPPKVPQGGNIADHDDPPFRQIARQRPATLCQFVRGHFDEIRFAAHWRPTFPWRSTLGENLILMPDSMQADLALEAAEETGQDGQAAARFRARFVRVVSPEAATVDPAVCSAKKCESREHEKGNHKFVRDGWPGPSD